MEGHRFKVIVFLFYQIKINPRSQENGGTLFQSNGFPFLSNQNKPKKLGEWRDIVSK